MSCTINGIYPFGAFRITTAINSIPSCELLTFSEGY